MRIRYLSHSCFEIRTKSGKTVLIDPFFEKNPFALEYEGKPDFVLVTHEHFDHADVSRFDCPVFCPAGVIAKNPVEMRMGEKRKHGEVELELVQSSHHQSKNPGGFIIDLEGKRLYHPGDTYLDGVRNQGRIDLFFAPIGGHYTMNSAEAIEALKIVKPKLAIPMHYNTFPLIQADPDKFREDAAKAGFAVKVMAFGEELEI